jgi:hypothetical protein
MRKGKKGDAIPPEALNALARELERLGDPYLEIWKAGKFCYVRHGGSPLCRLGYRGDTEIWDFAIYKYSTQRYSAQEFFPRTGTVAELVRMAMSAYNLR